MANQRNWIKILKIAIGSSFAFTIAQALELKYATSVPVITLLSIQDTRKDTIFLAGRRIGSFLITILSAFLIYRLMGFGVLAYMVFIFWMLIITYFLNWNETLSVNALIGMHFLAERSFSFAFLMNEVLVLLIGMIIALILNLYMPDVKRDIKKDITLLEEELQIILNYMAGCLKGEQQIEQIEKSLPVLKSHIEKGLNRAFDNMKNSFSHHAQYYIMYMEMRKSQSGLLENMRNSIVQITMNTKEAMEIAGFLEHIACSLHETNNVVTLMDDFWEIKQKMEHSFLPKTREEFENRAILYHLLLDTQRFLLMKQEFVQSLTEEQVNIYWNVEKKKS